MGDEADPEIDFSLKKKKKKKPVDGEDEATKEAAAPAGDDDDEALDFSKKKKKKKPKDDEAEEGGAAEPAAAAAADDDDDDDAALDFSKKKKKKPKAPSAEAEAPAAVAAPAACSDCDDDEDLAFTSKKKKKKKSKAPAAEAEPAGDDDDDDDEVGFATGGGDDDDDDDDDDDGDDDGGDDALVGEGGFMSIPAGREYKYEELLDRMYSLLIANNPELAGDRRKFLMKPPQVIREGSKRVVFTNFGDICKTMNRSIDHVNAFMLAEMGTTGSIDASNRMVIKGRFPPKAIEQIIRRYVAEYVTCSSCKSPATALQKQNRLFFMQCNNCGARRSVQPIKTGFVAIGKGARKKNRTG